MSMYLLKQGHKVVISGASQESTNTALEKLQDELGPGFIGVSLFGYGCNVVDKDQLERLREYSLDQLGHIDIWFNNAGLSHRQQSLQEMDTAVIDSVINVNILGVVYGSQVATQLFIQQGYGALYNMEGLGSDGRIVKGMSIYAGTKRFVRYFTRNLIKESENQHYIVGRIMPGMVTTDLLLQDMDKSDDPDKTRRIYAILADHVTRVAPWICEQMLDNKKNGRLISWLTTPKIIFRFMTAGFIKRNPFEAK